MKNEMKKNKLFDSMVQKWASLVVLHRWWIIVISIMLFIVSVYPMKNLYYDNSNELFFSGRRSKLNQF